MYIWWWAFFKKDYISKIGLFDNLLFINDKTLNALSVPLPEIRKTVWKRPD